MPRGAHLGQKVKAEGSYHRLAAPRAPHKHIEIGHGVVIGMQQREVVEQVRGAAALLEAVKQLLVRAH
jgi:hypothetical protein